MRHDATAGVLEQTQWHPLSLLVAAGSGTPVASKPPVEHPLHQNHIAVRWAGFHIFCEFFVFFQFLCVVEFQE